MYVGVRDGRVAQCTATVDRADRVGSPATIDQPPLKGDLESPEINAGERDGLGDNADYRLRQIDPNPGKFRIDRHEVFVYFAQRLRTRSRIPSEFAIERFELPAKVGKRSAELSSTATFRCGPATRSSVIQQSPRAIAAIPGCSGQLTRFHRRRP